MGHGRPQALLFRQLSPQVTVLEHTAAGLTGEQREQLGALGVAVIDGPVPRVESDGVRLTGVRLTGGNLVALDTLVVAPRLTANADLPEPLGL